MKSIVGQFVFFDGCILGRVTADQVRPVSWATTPQRVLTLDNGVALRDVTTPECLKNGFDVCPSRLNPKNKKPAVSPKWTATDCERAERQGWNLYWDDGTSETRHVERDDESAVFDSDEAALEFIGQNAPACPTCRKALMILGSQVGGSALAAPLSSTP